MKYTDHLGKEHEIVLSEFTKNELRLIEQNHQDAHRRNDPEFDGELDCCDREDYADMRLEAMYQ